MIPKFSIVIVNYNTKELLLSCLNSIQNKLHRDLSYEVIVVDNNSTDGSVSALEKTKFPTLKLIKSKTNLGFSKANNLAAKQAKGKYLFFLNSDTLIKKIDLKKIDIYFHNNQTVGLLAPKLLNKDGSIQASCYQKQTLKNAILEYWFKHLGCFSKYYPNTDKPVFVDCSVGAAIILPADIFWKLGGWDERYFMYFEDIQLCSNLEKTKKRVVYHPSFCITHLHGSSPHTFSQPSQQLIKSSKIFHGIVKYYLLYFILWSGQKIFLY